MRGTSVRIAFCAVALLAVLAGAQFVGASAQATVRTQVTSGTPAIGSAQASLASARTGQRPTRLGDPSWPVCAAPGASVPLPTDFPSAFPFPPGTVITASEQRNGGTVISAMAPWDVKSVAASLFHDLPASG